MKKSLTVIVILSVIILLFSKLFSFPTYEAIEKAEFTKAMYLSQEIEGFVKEKGHLPKDFQELADHSNFGEHMRNSLGLSKEESLSDIPIIDYSEQPMTFEIIASWKTNKDDYLVWVLMKDGTVFRTQQKYLEKEGKYHFNINESAEFNVIDDNLNNH